MAAKHRSVRRAEKAPSPFPETQTQTDQAGAAAQEREGGEGGERGGAQPAGRRDEGEWRGNPARRGKIRQVSRELQTAAAVNEKWGGGGSIVFLLDCRWGRASERGW